MSILPEFIFQSIIYKGIRALRNDLTLIDQLLKNLPSQTVADVKKFISENPISIVMQYPKQDTALPIVAITLRSEKEDKAVLGDVLGSDLSPPSDMVWRTEDNIIVNGLDQDIIGEPPKLFKANTFVDRRGSGYSEEYLIQIISFDYHVTVFLYVFIKAILTMNRSILEKNGIMNMVLGGEDARFEADYLPDYTFSRNLSISFLYFFDVFTEIPKIDRIDIEVDVKHEDGLDTTISKTSIDLK